jgi:hypothetical protein
MPTRNAFTPPLYLPQPDGWRFSGERERESAARACQAVTLDRSFGSPTRVEKDCPFNHLGRHEDAACGPRVLKE